MNTLIEGNNFDEIEHNKWYWIKKKYVKFRDERNIKLNDEQCVLVFLPKLQPEFDKNNILLFDHENNLPLQGEKKLTVVVYQSKENVDSGRKKAKVVTHSKSRGPSREILEANEELHPKDKEIKEFNNELILMVNAYSCESITIDAFGKGIEAINEKDFDFDKRLYQTNKELYPKNKVVGHENLRVDIAKGKPPVGDNNKYYFDQPKNGDRHFNETY